MTNKQNKKSSCEATIHFSDRDKEKQAASGHTGFWFWMFGFGCFGFTVSQSETLRTGWTPHKGVSEPGGTNHRPGLHPLVGPGKKNKVGSSCRGGW